VGCGFPFNPLQDGRLQTQIVIKRGNVDSIGKFTWTLSEPASFPKNQGFPPRQTSHWGEQDGTNTSGCSSEAPRFLFMTSIYGINEKSCLSTGKQVILN